GLAEEIEFNEITSGAKSDIDHATQFARSMVCEWGMSEKLGPLAYYEEQGEVFLGREVSHRQRNFSEKTAIDIDEEVRAIITEQYRTHPGVRRRVSWVPDGGRRGYGGRV